ncbi:MAG TPA: 50S ribosomal protein L11 methyltransferase [Solirubrobacteraceae bacterium]|nr:50S ribosomal protein L11 methyltransferase [Solirubrobacteraceae bacterium]
MIRLALRVRREQAEVALAELLALVPGGVEEVDLGDRVEYAVYGAPGELPDLPDLEAAAGEALVEIATTEVADDWAERWRAFHEPVDVGPLRVRPPWAEPRDGDLVIDPGQAFGTGGHETTRLCLELLLDLEPGGAFADLGCGSGVLAIAAARLGWSPVLAVDYDPLAVEATAANARANAVDVRAERRDLRGAPAPAAPTVAANLLRPLLLDVARNGFEDGERPEALIASGLLREEAGEVAAAFAAHGLAEQRRAARGEWAALLLRGR